MTKKGLEIKDLAQKVGSKATKQLGDLSLPVEIVEGSLAKELPLAVEGVTFTLNGAAGIFAFNSVDDADPLGVIGPAAAQSDEKLGPQIEIRPGSAWLKYQAQAGAKAAGGMSSTDFGFSFGAEGEVLVATYRIHEATDTVLSAIQEDLTSPRIVFSKKHIKALDKGEAVTLKARGKLTAGVELKWADVFSSSMSALGALLDAREVFAIKIDAGVTASFDVSLEDEFLVVFSRPSAGKIRVAIKKSDKKSLSAGIAAKIGAEFANKQAVQQVLGSVMAGLLGEPLKEVEVIVAKKAASLTGREKEIVARLLDRLGIEDPADGLAALRGRLAELQARAAQIVAQAANSRVELGFSYDYSRIVAESVLLQATLDEVALDAHHRKLIRGRLQGVLDAGLTPGSGVKLEKYLHEKTKKIRRSWGFSLSGGKWLKISGRDFKELTEVTRTTVDGRRQISFLGSRGYSGTVGEDKAEWNVDFNASMRDFSSTQKPLAPEFDYSLFLEMSLTEKRVKASELDKLLDLAIVWDAIAVGAAPAEAERLKSLIVGKGATFRYQLKLDDTAFRGILPALAGKPTRGFAEGLAAAMPWQPNFRPSSISPGLRKQLYGGLWLDYFEDRSLSPKLLAAKARAHLKSSDQPILARFEGRFWSNFRAYTIAGLAELNGETRQDWDGFSVGMAALKGAIDEGRSYQLVRSAYSGIRRLFAQSHHVEGLGVLLLDLLKGRSELLPHAERICTLEYTEGGKKKVESISTA